MVKKNFDRRSFFKFGFLSLATLPFFSKFHLGLSSAEAKDKKEACPATPPAGKTPVDPASPAAQRLNYVLDSGLSTHNLHKAGDSCLSCNFYRKEKEEGSWAPCTMLALKYVPSCGWCKSFKKKA